MRDHSRVVVIGGGMFGVSILYHLALEGWTDTLLIEKGELTSGSTWHAAGQCPNFVGSLSMAHIHHYATRLYPELGERTGQTAGWHGCGGLRLAYSEIELDWFRHVAGIARQVGYEHEIIPPDEIARHHPFLNTDGVLAAFRTMNDGHVDPTSTANAMASGARALGARISRRNRVTGIERLPSGEWLVRAEHGDVHCEHVINAAGSYCDQVAAWVGLELPMVNMVHQYLVTEPLKALENLDFELPVVRDPRSDSYLRQEQKGLLIGPYETEGAETCFADGVPWSFDQELLEPDIDRLMPWLERCGERLPLFAEAGIRRVVAGPITHLPDGGFLLGPAPGLVNHWLACGSSIGISQGAGAGRYLAQWMVHGDCEIDTAPFDPRRFGPWSCGDYARAKGIEEYQHMYAPVLPGEHRPAGRPVRTSPLYRKLTERGAHHTEIFGWERPTWFDHDGYREEWSFRRNNTFTAVAAECRAVMEGVGVMDMSSFAKFMVQGEGARAHLEHILANDMPERDGGIALAHFLSGNGRILGEVTVTRLAADRYYVLGGAGSELRDLDNLHNGAPEGGVHIENITDGFGVLVVAGPRSRDLLQGLCDDPDSFLALRWRRAAKLSFGSIATIVLRINYTGESGYELHAPMAELATLHAMIEQAGMTFGLTDFGAYAMNAMRLEKAYRGYGSELTNEVTLREAAMERFISSRKPFIGSEATREEPRFRLVLFEVDAGDADCVGSEPVMQDARIVGVTTSGGYGHRTGKSLAFAFVDPALETAGDLKVVLLGEHRRLTPLAAAPYDPGNERLRA
ncbi:MAG: GcvT family protein [Geminicoccaceae bacterium]|nr:GcvT family protein [Geminicoccaceae bacterium]